MVPILHLLKQKNKGGKQEKTPLLKALGRRKESEHTILIICIWAFPPDYTTKYSPESGITTSTAKLNIISSCNMSTTVTEQYFPMS